MPACLERIRLVELENEAMARLLLCAKALTSRPSTEPTDDAVLTETDAAFVEWHKIVDQIKEHEREHGCDVEDATDHK